ncbi:uncharacterized protein METZ01_LOCUS106660 [marine metagenome]|uniref:Uncharacterized protein n=1 Tax=marine metagenome TaxID=408172 RepID=A0A381WMQ2_9ZZZZ
MDIFAVARFAIPEGGNDANVSIGPI